MLDLAALAEREPERSIVETHRDNAIDPLKLAKLLDELAPAPGVVQLDAYMKLKRMGADMDDPLVQALVRHGKSEIAGGALGSETGATFRNTPEGAFVIEPELFEDATIRHTWSTATKGFRGYALKEEGFDLPSRGLLAEIELLFAGTHTRTDGSGTVATTDYNPYGLLELLELSVNGSPLKSAQGLSYEYRRQVVSKKASDAMTSTPNAVGANTWDLRWRIPVADNLRNLWGALLTQADDLSVRLDLTTAASAKIFTLTGTATAVFTNATWQLLLTAYDVPIVNIQGVGERAVLPDTDVLHRFHEYSVPVVAAGSTTLRMQRTAGEVERLFLFLDNASSTLMDPAVWSEVKFRYMATEEPIRMLAKSLLAENARNYTNRITPKCAVIDLAAYNQRRDGLFPRAVVDPEVEIVIPSSVTVNAGARLYGVQESLVGGA